METLFLHPSLLIASGVECITSRDARFLNAYLRFYSNAKSNLGEALVVSEEDFALGGILNPLDLFIQPSMAFKKCLATWSGFPCVTRREIYHKVYSKRIAAIFDRIALELVGDLQIHYAGRQPSEILTLIKRPKSGGAVYPKVVALHLCGMGNKLNDAFNYVIASYETMANTKN